MKSPFILVNNMTKLTKISRFAKKATIPFVASNRGYDTSSEQGSHTGTAEYSSRTQGCLIQSFVRYTNKLMLGQKKSTIINFSFRLQEAIFLH
ncbi:MAG: hypothetical protein C0490_02600 [Marivirga sp.]|nr:hypothetical protein [Marivirga sp.]